MVIGALAAVALEQLSRDLACTFARDDDPSCSFNLAPPESETGSPTLGFCTAVVPDGEKDLRWFMLERATYQVEDKGGTGRLVRVSYPLTGPGASAPPVTNELATGIERLAVHAFDGSAWKTKWPFDGSAVCPKAARIEIVARCGEQSRRYQTEVLIPVANVITSTLVRAGSSSRPQ